MRALVGGTAPDWEVRELEVPSPGPGDIRVRVHAAGLNRADLYMLEGAYSPLRKIRSDGGGDDSEAFPLSVGRLVYTVTPAGVYFVSQSVQDRFSLQIFRFATGKATELAKLDDVPGVGLSVSPDERHVLLTKLDQRGTDLILVENFH